MNDGTTSRARLPMPDIWRAWGRFVRRPVLPEQREPFGWRSIREVAWLLSLDIAFALPLAAILGALAQQEGVKTPEFAMLTDRGLLFTLLIGALVVPLFEEVVSRGWIDGRQRHLVLAAVVIAAVGTVVGGHVSGLGVWATLVLALGWIGIAIFVMIQVGRDVPAWFQRAFPWLFYLSAALFGLAHLSNYDMNDPLMLLPFVIPQFVGALIFGFARVRYGMWANIALHATTNALFLTLAFNGV